jgi:hypothetical protein
MLVSNRNKHLFLAWKLRNADPHGIDKADQASAKR